MAGHLLRMTILDLIPAKVHPALMRKQGEQPVFISRQVTQARRFYFGQEPRPHHASLEVICGGWELVKPDYRIQRTTFPWLAVEFVADGRGRLRMGGHSRTLQRGVCFAYGPGISHQIETDSEHLLSKYYLDFHGREAADLMASIGLSPGQCRKVSRPSEIEEMFEHLINEGSVNRPQAATIVALHLRILFLKLVEPDGGDEPGDQRLRQTFRRCLDYIDENFLEARTIQDVAHACHVSANHLTRAFARFGYGSPYRYLTRRKMLHAAALLDSGSLLVREVADRLALDQFQFSRVFKRVHGISPSDFVKRHGSSH